MSIVRCRSGWRIARNRLGLLLLISSLASCGTVRESMAAERQKEERCSESISDTFDRVSPAVVFIAATSINSSQLSNRVERIVGSGFIFDPSGLILTNSHVVFGRQLITVTLDDGTILPAQLVGADPIFDLAVLRIPQPSIGRLPTVAPGDSDGIRVGEEVLAIGNPLGLDQTLTRGIVSAINRVLPETPFSIFEPLIQTDAPINPGNSGGPLLNRCGEVIGINTAFLAEAQNIGFAIPINLAKTALPSLIAQGRVIRPWVGFHGQLVGEPLRRLLRIPLADGLLVEVIEPGSPAERAGIRGGQLEIVIAGRAFLVGGDIVTSVNGVPMDGPEKLFQIMRALKVGATISLRVFRDGEYRTVEYTLPERPILPGDLRSQGSLSPLTGRSPQGFSPLSYSNRRLSGLPLSTVTPVAQALEESYSFYDLTSKTSDRPPSDPAPRGSPTRGETQAGPGRAADPGDGGTPGDRDDDPATTEAPKRITKKVSGSIASLASPETG